MAEKKEFDFKHKEPITTKTDSVVKAIVKEDSNSDHKVTAPAIKPKAEPRNRRMQLLLTENNYAKLKEYATTCGTSMNDAVNQMIENLYV